MKKTKRYWYAERNSYGVNFTLDSIGWQVLRFENKRARDGYVEENEYRRDTGNRIMQEIDYKRMRDHLGYGKITWYMDNSGYAYELGVSGEL